MKGALIQKLSQIKRILNLRKVLILILLIIILFEIILNFYLYQNLILLSAERENLNKNLNQVSKELENLKSQDLISINKTFEEEIKNINNTFSSSLSSYESLLKLQEKTTDTNKQEALFAEILILLSKRDYEAAKTKISDLDNQIKDMETKIAEAPAQATPIPALASNSPPRSGYQRQVVSTNVGTFTVSIVAADLFSTRVIVDTASASSCPSNCPVLPLAEYVARNNAYAGINGSYFCPAAYPSCAGKENSFDTLLMNKDKIYFNSNNNVYSTNPAVIFGNGWIRFFSQSLEWGRDTGIDSMISNYPMLVQNGNIVFSGDSDPKKGSKGNRSFIANKGNTIYIGVVHNATVAESAGVMKALGMENALNLDDGGSTALWSGGYKVGPGRALPNAILFVRR